jgi:predicted RND superfamily exporter protein
MLKRYFFLISHYPIAVTVALLPIVAATGYLTQLVGVDNNIRIWFAQDDPAMKQYDSFLERFGRDVAVSVVFYGDKLFTEERMQKFKDGAQKLRDKPEWFEDSLSVGDVYSGWKDIRDKFPTLTKKDREAEPIDLFKRQVMMSDLFRGLLVSADGKAAALNFTLTESGNRFHRPAALDLAREVADDIAEGGLYDMVGQPVHGAELDRLSMHVKKLYSLIILVAFLMMLITFRSIGLAFYGAFAVVTTLFILQGYVYMRGLDLNVVTAAMPTLVIVISVANCVHLTTEFRQELSHGVEASEALREAAKHVFWPCLLNAMTTSLGFLSLMTSGMIPIRNLGELAAIGVVLSFLVCMTVMIAGISLCRRSVARGVASRPPKPEEAEFFYKLAGVIYEFRREVVYASIVIAAGALWSILQLRVETNPLEFFPESNAFAQSHRRVERDFTGLSPFSIEVTGTRNMLETKNLRALETIQEFIATDPDLKGRIVRSTSAADMIKEMNRLSRGGGEFMDFIPGDEEILKKVLDGMPERLKKVLHNNFLADEEKTARIAVRAKTVSSSDYTTMLDRLSEWMNKTFEGELTTKITGVVPLINSAQGSILTSQLQSFGLADILILFVYMVLLRNPIAAVVVMFANMVPIFVTMGSMYWMNISLNASTVMIASAAIGITVDDSLHFLHRYSHELHRFKQRKKAIRGTLRSIGKSIAINSMVNGVGFSVLFFSGFMPTVYFGGLLGLAMVTAGIGLLVILPGYILVFGIAGKETPGSPLDMEDPDL